MPSTSGTGCSSISTSPWSRRTITLPKTVFRPFVFGRKNWLFSGTPRHAEASALLYSLIETAWANNCEPYSYLRHIFTHLPRAQSLADYEALLPWNLDRAKIMLATVERAD